VSRSAHANFHDGTLAEEVGGLVERFSREGETARALDDVKGFADRFRGFLQVDSGDATFDTYANRALPFQVLYQTFVSRSFAQTQKAFREIGFREIQDLFASMYYLAGMGQGACAKSLLGEWCAQVHAFGYGNHNFYWSGKEPGKYSDDALWFVQALHRYVCLTGDVAFLDEERPMADGGERKVFDTVLALLRYSGEISVGRHGLPLIDNADWNDCLNLDPDCIDGPAKEALYRQQIADGTVREGEGLDSHFTESVMNAFLLNLALDLATDLARLRDDAACADELGRKSADLADRIQEHAWKGDFFARALLNRFEDGRYTYLGAGGDGLSSDPAFDGAYFLNSFSWSVLSGVATEDQIATMLDVVERTLKTPAGLRVVSPVAIEKLVASSGTGQYFPGDRENGAVFKHASMMAAAALVRAANDVADRALAERLADLAWWMIDITLPPNVLDDPFVLCGNPRFCTQYNNTATRENIGPMLSGTATWLLLSLMSALGVEFTRDGLRVSPVLRGGHERVRVTLRVGETTYRIAVSKPRGFRRVADGARLTLDGRDLDGDVVPLVNDGAEHDVELALG